MIGWFVFVVDVFWWVVLNGIIVFCLYSIYSRTYSLLNQLPPENIFDSVRSIIPKAKPKSHLSSEPKPKTNPTKDFKRKYK